MLHFIPFYGDLYHWWYNSLGVSMHFMSIIPDAWTWNLLSNQIFYWFDSTWYHIVSASGAFNAILLNDQLWIMRNAIGIIIFTMIVGTILDYLILSEISDFYKRRNIQKSHNKIFAYFYVLWRVIMPDIFVASTLSAIWCKITLSRKNIFLLSVLAQILRFIFIVILWCIFAQGWPMMVLNAFKSLFFGIPLPDA